MSLGEYSFDRSRNILREGGGGQENCHHMYNFTYLRISMTITLNSPSIQNQQRSFMMDTKEKTRHANDSSSQDEETRSHF